MKLKTNLLALLLLIIGTVALNAQTQTPITVYTGVCGSQYYRIPAIVTANNGDLLFFNDDRKNNNSDVGRRDNSTDGIDLLVKRLSYNSTNGSYTTSFTSSQNITPNKSQYYYCYGDPAVVVDRESGNVLVLTIGGEGASTDVWYKNKTSFVIKSADNGQTWSPPVQVSLQTITDNSSVTGFFFASGRILQSKVIKKQGSSFYRIYSALLYTGNNNGTGPNYNKVFYSDDFGTTWNLLGGTDAQTSADEAKLEELPNGDLILSTRAAGGRYFNTFTYSDVQNGMGSWGTPLQFYRFTTNTFSTCTINGDMLTMTAYRKSDNQEVTLLLQSTITGRSNSTDAADSRKNIKIFYHEIDNNTTVDSLTSGWTPTSFTLPNTSVFGGYSAMTLQADDKIGVYYEGNTDLCTLAGNDFSNLYYIAYTLEELTGNHYTLTNPNPPTDPGVEVPDSVVPIYQWQGTNSDRWSDPLNWTVINAVNNTPLARGMVPPTPDENSNVKIEAPGDGEYNPVLDAPLTINNLYVAPGAAIGNQYWLRVKERVYTDVEIPTNQWVRMSMPLRDTYSGDMYTTTQGGVMPDDEFTAATYNPSDGNSGNNRVFPYAIYQRVFSDAVNVMTDDQTGTEVRQLNSSWSVPYNDLAAKYQVAEGFDLWAPSTNATATFRFPSATNDYYYYYSNGNASTRKETVNHAASGTMAYGNSGNGVMDVTVTRAKRSNGQDSVNGVPMYAVGNPSFSYLDVAEFIRVNAYGASHLGNASVVGNITPYVYKYDEGENLNGGEASETIYYLDNDKKLHKVTAAVSDTVSNTTMPDNSTLADADGVFVAPTRGFRVMAGQAEVSAVEPKLIGDYSTSNFKIAPMKYGTTTELTGGTNTYSYISSLAPNSTGEYTTTLTISLGSTPDEVIMNGFCVSNVLVGKVDPIEQTITVKGGSVVGWQTDNSTWQVPTVTSGTRSTNRHIYAWDGTSKGVTKENIGGLKEGTTTYYYTEYASGLSADNDIVFDYTIASDGQIQITCRSGFAIYTIADNNATVNNVSSRDYPISWMRVTYSGTSPYHYPLTFNVYESFSATTTRTTTEESYICPEMFGAYKYLVTGIDGAESGITKNSEHSFNILPIEGAYDVVRITDFYAGTGTTYSHDGILGYITPSGSTYTLTIPSAQVVAYGSTGDFGQFKALYKRLTGATTRSSDPSILTWNAASKVFTIQDYNSTSGRGSFQVSMYDGNGGAYYANGFSGTTTTQPVAVTVSQESELISNDLLLLCHGSYDFYLSQSGKNDASGNYISEENALSQTYYRFVLEKSGDNYYLKSVSSNRYLQVSGTTLKWVNNGSQTPISISYETSGWVLMPSSSTNSYLRLTASGLSVSGSISYWSIFKVVNQSVFTTGTSAGQYIPQTAAWSGATSGGSSTSDFTVGTNYEAINLKFTPLMFEANPVMSSSSASSAPRKTAAQGSTMASVKLVDGDRTANTLITRRENAKNGFNAFEDASVIDLDNTTKLLATLAGNQVVAVNTLGDTTAVQLYLRNLNGNFTLTFDNLEALGSNARLVDNETGMQTPLNGRHQDLTLSMTVNDSPLRYSIIWDVVSGTEEVEFPLTDGDLWFKALSTAKGTIKVVSSENMASVRLFDSTGKLVGRKVNAQNETMFEYLLSGIYVVEVSNGSETQSMKVNVK